MGYFAAMKANRLQIRDEIWMDLENVLLCERSQTQQTAEWMIPLIKKCPEKGKSRHT